MQYFYDHQIRRYLLQFIRLFSGFSVEIRYNTQNEPVYQTVPVRYGDVSRMAAHIVRENSENKIHPTPFISCYVSDLTTSPDRRAYQQHKDKVQVFEKKYDRTTGEVVDDDIGNRYEVERYQPVPYDLTMQVDIWTSNTNQKLQLLEQILVLFNPTLNINTTDNPVDWTSLSYVELINSTWSTRAIPSGVDETIDVATLQFYMPIWISPPAKVRRQTLIQNIITRMQTAPAGTVEDFDVDNPVGVVFTGYSIATLGNYKVDFTDGVATLLNAEGGLTDDEGNTLSWENALAAYGAIRTGISQLRLKPKAGGDDLADTEDDIIGTISLITGQDNKLSIAIDEDTLEADTVGTVDAIIDPTRNGPGDGVLPAASSGQTYLILAPMPLGGDRWTTSAQPQENDIVTYNGAEWIISFDASESSGPEYTTNTQTDDQYEWTGEYWQNSYEGVYEPGYWRIYI